MLIPPNEDVVHNINLKLDCFLNIMPVLQTLVLKTYNYAIFFEGKLRKRVKKFMPKKASKVDKADGTAEPHVEDAREPAPATLSEQPEATTVASVKAEASPQVTAPSVAPAQATTETTSASVSLCPSKLLNSAKTKLAPAVDEQPESELAKSEEKPVVAEASQTESESPVTAAAAEPAPSAKKKIRVARYFGKLN